MSFMEDEWTVLQQFLKGDSNNKIGQTVGIDPLTVAKRLDRIAAEKFGLDDRKIW